MNEFKDAFDSFFAGKKIFLTGHTGFKGSWLSEWLLGLGAEVTGIGLVPDTSPSLFDQLNLVDRLDHHIGDIRDYDLIKSLLLKTQPDIIFHLAAQPLVRLSYAQPLETYSTNVMGTLNLLDALRSLKKPCSALFVTTDKCYENKEWLHGYREEDPMGGYDPYSSSKGCAELAINSFRQSFFNNGSSVKIASARAGNVIGGGDWAVDRILPDCIRALAKGEVIQVRNPAATRPWQHVLEPLSGYLLLTYKLYLEIVQGDSSDLSLASAFNFGPNIDSNYSVETLLIETLKYWPGKWCSASEAETLHEAHLLNLSTDKAFHRLGWQPVWDFNDTIQKTVQWYQQTHENTVDPYTITVEQIVQFMEKAAEKNYAWARKRKLDSVSLMNKSVPCTYGS